MNDKVIDPQAARRALPFLVELGLATECTVCGKYQELADQLSKPVAGVSVIVSKVQVEEPDRTLYDVHVLGRLDVHCSRCLNTGVVPTDRGLKVLGFVKAFMQCASVRDLDKIEEIPF